MARAPAVPRLLHGTRAARVSLETYCTWTTGHGRFGRVGADFGENGWAQTNDQTRFMGHALFGPGQKFHPDAARLKIPS
jgi:hypothetical protein